GSEPVERTDDKAREASRRFGVLKVVRAISRDKISNAAQAAAKVAAAFFVCSRSRKQTRSGAQACVSDSRKTRVKVPMSYGRNGATRPAVAKQRGQQRALLGIAVLEIAVQNSQLSRSL